MSRSVWMAAVLGPVVLAVLRLRWALADFLLDQFGSLPDSMTRAQHPDDERRVSGRSEFAQSSDPEAIEQ